MMKINLFQIFTDTFSHGSQKLLILNEYGQSIVQNEKKQSLRIEDLDLQILMIHGIEEFLVLTLCSKKTD